MPGLDKLKIDILEEGMQEHHMEALVDMMATAKMHQSGGADAEKRIKEIWQDAYDRNEVPKTVTVKGIKMQVSDAGKPKETITPGHWQMGDIETLIETYGVESLVGNGIIEWVPEKKTTTPGKKAGVSVTLPK